jgi:predicted dehydrogenase
MDTQNVMNMISVAAIGAGGWFAREIWGAVKELRRDLHSIETELPKTYVSKFDMNKRMDHIEVMFQRIYDKLDGKADK